MAVLGRVNGVGVNIAFDGTPGGLTFADAGIQPTLILQTGESSNEAEEYNVFDEAGNLTADAWLNPQAMARLEFIISGTGQANAIAQTQLCANINPGDIGTISACNKMPQLVATNWEVLKSPKISGSNKDAKKYSFELRRSAGITQQMPA